MEYYLNPELAREWEKDFQKLSPELKAYILYAAEILREELGLKPKGTTTHRPWAEPTEEDRRAEPRKE